MKRALALALMLMVAACDGGSSGLRVTASEYGEDWPYTVDSGTLECDRDAATFTDPSGTKWALNGVAMSRGVKSMDDSIWLADEETMAQLREAFPDETPATIRMSEGDLLTRALALCE
jgi:hypothetical protein